MMDMRTLVRSRFRLTTVGLLAVFLSTALIAGVTLILHQRSQTDLSDYYLPDQAVIDLQGQSLDQLGVLRLSGEWEFYWNQLLTPNDFAASTDLTRQTALLASRQLADADTGWRQLPNLPDFRGTGAATYRLVIQNLNHNGHLAIKKANIRNASRIYINGDLIVEDGQPGLDQASHIPGNVPQVVFFETSERELEIIVQISAFGMHQGGFGRPLLFGTQQAVMTQSTRQYSFELITSLILFLIALAHSLILLNMYLTRMAATRQFMSFSLLLMLVFFIFALQNMLINERVLYQLFPQLDYQSLVITAQLSQILLSILMLTTIYQINRQLVSKVWIWMIFAVSAGLAFLILSPWPDLYYQYVYIPSSYYYTMMLVILARSIQFSRQPYDSPDARHERIGAVIVISLVILYGISSLAYQSGYLHNMLTAQISALLVSTVMLYLYLNRLLIATRDKHRVEAELAAQRLEADRREMDFLRAQINPHFIYNALSVILSLIMTEPSKASKLLSDLSTYLRASFDFKRLSHTATLAQELSLLKAYVEIEKARFGQRLNVTIDVDPTLLNRTVPPLLLQPLVENAIRHGVLHREAGGSVKVAILPTNDGLKIQIQDDGQGMTEDKIQQILNPQPEQLAALGEDLAHVAGSIGPTPEQDRQNSGIALRNIVRRLRTQYHSDLQIISKPGQGTTLTIDLP